MMNQKSYSRKNLKRWLVNQLSLMLIKTLQWTYMIHMEMALSHGQEGESLHARFKRQVIDDDGQPVGVESLNPITDTRLYEVEYFRWYN